MFLKLSYYIFIYNVIFGTCVMTSHIPLNHNGDNEGMLNSTGEVGRQSKDMSLLYSYVVDKGMLVINYVNETEVNNTKVDLLKLGSQAKLLAVGDSYSSIRELPDGITGSRNSKGSNKNAGNVRGYDINSKRNTCSNVIGYATGGITICRYRAYLRLFTVNRVNAWLNEYAYGIALWGSVILDVTASSFSIALNVLGYSKKSGCGGGVYSYNTSGRHWRIAISTWTRDGKVNCGTTANIREIADVLDKTLAEWSSRDMMAGCIRLDHEGDWVGDVRIKDADDSDPIWDIPCNIK